MKKRLIPDIHLRYIYRFEGKFLEYIIIV